jgi:hypothetical protein
MTSCLKYGAKVKLFTTLFICVSVCSYGQVMFGYFGDTLKGNIKKMTEYRYRWLRDNGTLTIGIRSKSLGKFQTIRAFYVWRTLF